MDEKLKKDLLDFLKTLSFEAAHQFNTWDIKKEKMPDLCEHMQDLSYFICELEK